MDKDPSQKPQGDEKFVAGENEFAALGDEGDDGQSSESDKKLEKSGLDKLISPDDTAAMQAKAAELADSLADELVQIRPNTPEYRRAKAEWLAMQNIAEGASAYEGQADEGADMYVRAHNPYEELARIKERELTEPQREFQRSLRTANVANPELAQAEIGLVRVALAAEKIRLAGAARESLPVDPGQALFYEGMAAALESYQQGDRSVKVDIGNGTQITAEEYMKGHIDQARQAEAEKVRLAREAHVEQPVPSAQPAAEAARPPVERAAEPESRPTTDEVVPTDDEGMQAYEKKWFTDFDPANVDKMRAFASALIGRLDQQHASANNPNIRYPDTLGQVMGGSIEEQGANMYLAHLYNSRTGPDGPKITDVRQLLPMKFSDFAKKYLDMDVEATHPNYFKVFRPS